MKTTPATINQDQPILLFDGVCNLCNGAIQYVIKNDPKGKFRFSALQNEFSQNLLKSHDPALLDLDTVMLVYKDKVYVKSNAALESARLMGGLHSLLYIFKIVPRFLRDPIYNWVAKNRYRWFGKKDSCWLPTPELKARFID